MSNAILIFETEAISRISMTALTLASLYDAVHTLERVLGSFPVLILAADRAGRVVMTTERTRDTLGRAEVELLDLSLCDVVPGLSPKIGMLTDGDLTVPPLVEIGATRRRALRRDGTAFPVEVQASAHRLGDDVICVVAMLDMTERLQADRAVRDSQALLDAVLCGLPAMVSAKAPDGTYEFVNAYQADVFGIAPEDAVGRTAADLLGPESGRPIDGADRRIASGTAISHSGQEKLIDGEGRARTFMTTRAAMRDAKGHVQRVLTVALDVTHATATEERLDRLALLDELTGLPNRGALQQILSAQIRRAKRDTQRLGVIVLTLSNLTEITAEHGEAGRDAVLRRLAIRLGGLVAETSVLARFDDTSFALILPDPEDHAGLERDAGRLIAKAGRPVPAAGATVAVKCRAGLALYPESGIDAEALLRAAEHALRASATRPIATARQSAEEIESFLSARQETTRALRRELEHDGLAVRFRPIHDLATRSVTGLEACLADSAGRLLLPTPSLTATSLPAAPLTADHHLALAAAVDSLAPELCERLLRDGCAIADRRAAMHRITVPLPADMLHHHDLVEMVEDALYRARLTPARLRLAIEESAVGRDPEAAREVLQRLERLGVALALTGFGTGGNPMLALAKQPITHVILAADTVEIADTATAAAVAFAQALDLTVGAAGVGTAAELDALQRIGCAEASGPALGEPQDAAGVPEAQTA